MLFSPRESRSFFSLKHPILLSGPGLLVLTNRTDIVLKNEKRYFIACQRLTELHDVAHAESEFVPECTTYSKRNLMLSPNFLLTWELKQPEKNAWEEGEKKSNSPEAAASKTILKFRATQFVNYWLSSLELFHKVILRGGEKNPGTND